MKKILRLSAPQKRVFILAIIILIIGVLTLMIMASKQHIQKKHVEDRITVTILPIKFLVDAISNNSINVDVLVPAGSSPESYEPVAQQIIGMEKSSLILTTGLLEFENMLVKRVSIANVDKIINLSTGIELLAGDCGRANSGLVHSHGIDPHIWTSPKSLKIMAKNSYDAIIATYPDSLHYTENYKDLLAKLDELDKSVADILIANDVKCFLIYHPALTYYSNDYGIEQLSFEHEGKEPSVELMKINIDRARSSKVRKLLYQREFSRTMVETIAKDIGVEIVEINPLAEDIIGNILSITNHIAR